MGFSDKERLDAVIKRRWYVVASGNSGSFWVKDGVHQRYHGSLQPNERAAIDSAMLASGLKPAEQPTMEADRV